MKPPPPPFVTPNWLCGLLAEPLQMVSTPCSILASILRYTAISESHSNRNINYD